jgi:hypothetical protein
MPRPARGYAIPLTTTRIRRDTLSRLRIVRAQESRFRGRYVSTMDLLEELTCYAEDRVRRRRLTHGAASGDALSDDLVQHAPMETP